LKYTEILSIFLCYTFSTKNQSLFIFSTEYFSLFFIRLKRVSYSHLSIILGIIKSFYILFIYFCLYHFLITTIPILYYIFNHWKIAFLRWYFIRIYTKRLENYILFKIFTIIYITFYIIYRI
jgi:hypothetical protein